MSKVVLLAEDDKMQAMVQSNILKSCGYEVLLAVNGQEAVDLFKVLSIKKKNAGRINAVILDLNMPVKDGFQAAIEIRGLQKQIGCSQKVFGVSAGINLTADDDEDTVHEVKVAGMNGLLEKPLNKGSLHNIF